MRKFVLTIAILFSALTYAAAQAQRVEMADNFRGEGKIYVLVAVVAIVLAGLIAYAVRIDRKVTKLEERMKEESQEL